jgi:hypothetical protein
MRRLYCVLCLVIVLATPAPAAHYLYSSCPEHTCYWSCPYAGPDNPGKGKVGSKIYFESGTTVCPGW